ncbi:1-phosphofructokinase family hexose kinase [Candidatus Margulisiibacteriota bacterium]
MLVTVTLSPALDHLLYLSETSLGGVNRVAMTHRTPGGKGVNVANSLAVLGEKEVVATGFLGGMSGQMFEESLRKIGVTTNFIYTNQELRTDFYLIEENKNRQTMIIEEGPSMELRYLNHFKSNFNRLLSSATLVEIGGSLPKGVPPIFVKELIDEANKKNIKVVVNLREEILKECLGKTSLFILNPDLRGCKELFCKNMGNADTRKEAAKEALNKGAEIVIFNYDRFKYMVATKKESWEGDIEPDKNEKLIRIGTRDGMLAGFIHRYLAKGSISEALKYGIAAALSTARNKLNYPVSKKDVDHLVSKAKIRKVD